MIKNLTGQEEKKVLTWRRSLTRKNWRLVTDEPVEFEKYLVEAQDYMIILEESIEYTTYDYSKTLNLNL